MKLLFLLLFLIPLLAPSPAKSFHYKKYLHHVSKHPEKPHPDKGIILLTFNGYKPKEPLMDYVILPSSLLLQNEQLTIQKQVGEFFKDYDVTITTDDSLFYTYPQNHRIRAVITSIPLIQYDMFGFVYKSDGLSFYNTLYFGDTSASLISTSGLADIKFKYPLSYNIAVAIAHEAGHQLGLAHQSDWNGLYKTKEYSLGDSTEGPIMGISLYSKNSRWSTGTNAFGQYQDDTAIISQTFRRLYVVTSK